MLRGGRRDEGARELEARDVAVLVDVEDAELEAVEDAVQVDEEAREVCELQQALAVAAEPLVDEGLVVTACMCPLTLVTARTPAVDAACTGRGSCGWGAGVRIGCARGHT